MPNPPKHIMIIAGEASGDLHAAHLIEAIKRLDSSISFSGLGGSRMKAVGVEIYYDLTKLALIGFVEVLKHYSEIKKAFNLILKKIDETQIDTVILVDYPGFNLRLAKELKKRHKKVIYYISPQVWAWKRNRVYLIQKYVDKMLVFFEFEKNFYAQFGIHVDCVGNPLIDEIQITQPKEKFLQAIGLQDFRLTIGLLPGSRAKEIETHLPLMLESAQILNKEYPMMQFLVIKASTISNELINHYLKDYPTLPIKIVEDQTYNGINACDLCIVTSGTATLETAILQKPMVVIYKTSFLTWALAKIFIKIPDIGLVNVVAGKRIVPECVQFQATSSLIARELKDMFTNEPRLADIKSELRKVKSLLGSGGASERAAKEILNVLGR